MRSRLSTLTVASLAAIFFVAAQATAVHAGNILNFGMNNSDSITATETGGISTSVTTTPIAGGGGQPVTITLLNGTADSISAYLDLSATSVGPATSFHGSLYQNFDGSFTITANANGTGTNYLSGTFTNVAFDSQLSGLIGGTGATLTASDPTATITFTSSVITVRSAKHVDVHLLRSESQLIPRRGDDLGLHSERIGHVLGEPGSRALGLRARRRGRDRDDRLRPAAPQGAGHLSPSCQMRGSIFWTVQAPARPLYYWMVEQKPAGALRWGRVQLTWPLGRSGPSTRTERS